MADATEISRETSVCPGVADLLARVVGLLVSAAPAREGP
jgi:hypothetical protein